jgi:hypothetical protein
MKRFLLFTLIVLTVFASKAQNGNGNRLEALKIGYLTKKLDLSPEEAQKFWPVYNLYSAEMKQTRRNAVKNGSTEIEYDEAALNVRKKYSSQFNQVLSPQKVDTFFKSEKEFDEYVQKELIRRQLKNQQRRLQDPTP